MWKLRSLCSLLHCRERWICGLQWNEEAAPVSGFRTALWQPSILRWSVSTHDKQETLLFLIIIDENRKMNIIPCVSCLVLLDVMMSVWWCLAADCGIHWPPQHTLMSIHTAVREVMCRVLSRWTTMTRRKTKNTRNMCVRLIWSKCLCYDEKHTTRL